MAAYQDLQLLRREIEADEADGAIAVNQADIDRIGVRMAFTDLLRDIEPAWRALEAQGIDSPGQAYDFVRVWIETFEIPRADQAFVAVEVAGRPLMVAAFERRTRFGVRMLQPFAGSHVGVNAPLMDRTRMVRLSQTDRRVIWSRIGKALGADLIRCGRVRAEDAALLPDAIEIPSDSLYRTEFSSWEDCDRQQRTRSRRKHDKQQGAKLAALGAVSYEEIGAEDDASAAMDILFADRAARFSEQGIEDPFATPKVRAFYRSIFANTGALTGHMQVLRLDEAIVAARYNLVAGDRMFCLISSMNTEPKLQPGSPGKQILVYLMQRIFAAGTRIFDMGAGFTDEKRHWCNVCLPLVEALMPTTVKGKLFALLVSIGPRLKHAVKSNQKLFAWAKSLRARLSRRN